MYVAGNKLLNYYLGLKLTSANFYHFDNDKLSKQIIIWIDTVGFYKLGQYHDFTNGKISVGHKKRPVSIF